MNKVMKAVAALMLMTAVVIATGCKKESGEQPGDQQEQQKAKVETSQVTNVTSTSATAGGMVVSDGNCTIIERGVCWTVWYNSHTPTVNDYHVSAGSGIGTFTCKITDLEPSTHYYVRAYVLNDMGVSYGERVDLYTTENNGGGGGGNGGGGSNNGDDYVDLGLPSGLLWATCNVGATTPEGYGSYFAWGETTTKTIYNWSTYKYCNGDEYSMTKYCNVANYGYAGFIDNIAILQAMDDAATVNQGNEWRTPTQSEWYELIQNTSNTWITQNGVKGRLFTSNNGQSIFLPAAGFRVDGEIYSVGSNGFYWLSSLDLGSPSFAYDISFGSEGYELCRDYRSFGFTVRPVRSAK